MERERDGQSTTGGAFLFFFFIAAVSNANPQFASEAPQRNAGVDEVVRLSDIYLWPRAKPVH